MKNGFTKTQMEMITTVSHYLDLNESFADSVIYTSNDLGYNDWYINDTYNSYRNMQKVIA